MALNLASALWTHCIFSLKPPMENWISMSGFSEMFQLSLIDLLPIASIGRISRSLILKPQIVCVVVLSPPQSSPWYCPSTTVVGMKGQLLNEPFERQGPPQRWSPSCALYSKKAIYESNSVACCLLTILLQWSLLQKEAWHFRWLISTVYLNIICQIGELRWERSNVGGYYAVPYN